VHVHIVCAVNGNVVRQIDNNATMMLYNSTPELHRSVWFGDDDVRVDEETGTPISPSAPPTSNVEPVGIRCWTNGAVPIPEDVPAYVSFKDKWPQSTYIEGKHCVFALLSHERRQKLNEERDRGIEEDGEAVTEAGHNIDLLTDESYEEKKRNEQPSRNVQERRLLREHVKRPTNTGLKPLRAADWKAALPPMHCRLIGKLCHIKLNYYDRQPNGPPVQHNDAAIVNVVCKQEWTRPFWQFDQ
jgi:hypothetical protein